MVVYKLRHKIDPDPLERLEFLRGEQMLVSGDHKYLLRNSLDIIEADLLLVLELHQVEGTDELVVLKLDEAGLKIRSCDQAIAPYSFLFKEYEVRALSLRPS